MATNPVTPPPEERSDGLTAADATAAHTLPGFLSWEDDLEMVSKYVDRKVLHVVALENLLIAVCFNTPPQRSYCIRACYFTEWLCGPDRSDQATN